MHTDEFVFLPKTPPRLRKEKKGKKERMITSREKVEIHKKRPAGRKRATRAEKKESVLR